MTLQVAAGIAVAITTLASGLLVIMFRLSVKREAPQLYESLWAAGGTVRLKMLLPYLKLVYLRQYRVVLADYRRSRAWASWLFAVGWLQLAALATLVVAALDRSPC